MTILHCMHHGFTLSMSSLVFTYGIWYFKKNKNLCHCAFLFFCSHSATLCVSLKKKIVIVVLFCLLQPYVWTGPSISMCSPLMETAIERPSMCIWTYVMMTTFKATQRLDEHEDYEWKKTDFNELSPAVNLRSTDLMQRVCYMRFYVISFTYSV